MVLYAMLCYEIETNTSHVQRSPKKFEENIKNKRKI